MGEMIEEHDMLNWLKANRKVICARCSIGSEIFKNNLVFLSIYTIFAAK